MAVNDEPNDVIFEIDENGQRVIVRSLTSVQCAFIRFINRVSRPVDVWWRNFEGRRQHYVRMEPRTYFNIDTFISHPWEFTDPATNENYVVNNRVIFRPPTNLAGMRHRTNWIISVRVKSLRSIVLLALAMQISNDGQSVSMVPSLGLPRQLGADLGDMIYSLQNVPAPPSRI